MGMFRYFGMAAAGAAFVLGAASAKRLSAAKGRLNTVFATLILLVALYMGGRSAMALLA